MLGDLIIPGRLLEHQFGYRVRCLKLEGECSLMGWLWGGGGSGFDP